jgi:hypothetical protein
MSAAAKEPRAGSAHVLMAAIATASMAYGDFRLTLLPCSVDCALKRKTLAHHLVIQCFYRNAVQ